MRLTNVGRKRRRTGWRLGKRPARLGYSRSCCRACVGRPASQSGDRRHRRRVAASRSNDLVTVVRPLLGTQPARAPAAGGPLKRSPAVWPAVPGGAVHHRAAATGCRGPPLCGLGLIKGIGPRLAERICDRFGPDSLTVIEQTLERLLEAPGIARNGMRCSMDCLACSDSGPARCRLARHRAAYPRAAGLLTRSRSASSQKTRRAARYRRAGQRAGPWGIVATEVLAVSGQRPTRSRRPARGTAT